MSEKVDSISFGLDLWAHNDPTVNEKDPTLNGMTGTKRSGYSEEKYGPYRCDNCIHFEKEKSGCDNTHVLADPEIKGTKELKIVQPGACCTYFRNKSAKVPASAKIEAAAELPDIEGFDKKTTREITKYLMGFPRRLLHYTKTVKAAPELAAIHGRYSAGDQVVLINPKNFSSKMKFGTHDPADIDEHVLAHELGHGLYENLSDAEQGKWMALSGWKKGTGPGQAKPYIEVRPGWPKKISEWTHKSDAKFARRYQEKAPNEEFADDVAYIATGNGSDVPEDKRNFVLECLGISL